jgi:hypothetical protein
MAFSPSPVASAAAGGNATAASVNYGERLFEFVGGILAVLGHVLDDPDRKTSGGGQTKQNASTFKNLYQQRAGRVS